MTITLYSEPNFKGDSFEFDPINVNHILYQSPKYNTPPSYKLMLSDIQDYNRLKNDDFAIGSVKNSSNDFFIIIVDFEEFQLYPVYGLVKKMNFISKSRKRGYIKRMKNPKNYKTVMIVFIILSVAMIIIFSFLLFNGTVTFQP